MSYLKTWKDFMNSTIKNFSEKYEKKYIRGVEEHGGNLHRKPTTKMLEWGYDEILDFVSYWGVVEDQVKQIQAIVFDALNNVHNHALEPGSAADYYESALTKISNIINLGNAEGVVEKGD